MKKSTMYSIAMIVIAAVFLFLYLGVTLNNPFLFGDEGYHATISRWMLENGEIPTQTPLFYETKITSVGYLRPPFPHMLFGGVNLLGWNESVVQFIIPLFSILGALLIYIWMRDISHEAGILGSLIFLLIPSQITHALLLYVDSLLLLTIILSLLFFHRYLKTKQQKYKIATGAMAALAILTKLSAPILILAIMVYPILKGDKKLLKNVGIIILIMVVLVAPWFLRNTILYGSPTCDNYPFVRDLFNNENCDRDFPPTESEFSFAGRTNEAGTEGGFLQFGILNFFKFAYGDILMLLLIAAGLTYAYLNKDKANFAMPLIFLVSMTLLFPIAFSAFGGRVEDSSRYILPVVIPFAVLGGAYLESIIKTSKKFKLFALIGVLIVVALIVQTGYGKITNMSPVKSFPAGLIEASEWIDKNTDENSATLSLWTAQTVYNSHRRSVWSVPDLADILLSQDDSKAIPILHKYGITHILVSKSSISRENYSQSYPVAFIDYITSSDKFANVYENGDGAVFELIETVGE